ncbi:DNA-processing protein DprA [Arachnia propionica]|uniref:DNA-processing protein DprA n=1 Tax=Arachnia propionica TaxID=1750 RepID=UPI003C6F7B5D
MTNVAERRARMALCALQVAADPRLAHLVETHGAQEVWEAIRRQGESTSLGRRAQGVDPEALAAATTRSGAGFLVPGDEFWPDTLSDLGMCQLGDQGGLPLGLWVAGNPELLRMPRAVAVVGARAATGYGLHVAGELAADLSASGWLVISGLAFGIDSAAHRGALAAGGLTLAVMATGVDKTYPAGHHGLRNQIQASGAVITELAPGTHPLRASFLGRNRLIAALGSGTVVVEAGARSGARNTISWAAELGRVTMAVPGPVTSSLSVAPHHLIRESMATLVTSATDVTALLSPLGAQEELPLRGEDRPVDSLPAPLRTVREAVPVGTTLGAAELAVATGMTVPEVIAAAAELTELGWLEDTGPGWRLPGG